MISFPSVSKGFIGECGIRGGYFELHNIDDAVKQNLYKLASISLCSNTHGQVLQSRKLTNVQTGSYTTLTHPVRVLLMYAAFSGLDGQSAARRDKIARRVR